MDTNEVITVIAQEEKRLQELSIIPKSKKTDDERKEYMRLSNRKSRRKTNTTEGMKKLLERAERAETQEQFWQLNRAEESPKQLELWLAQQQIIEDMLHWMAHWQELADDECFVSLEGGLDLIADSVSTNGYIRDAFSYDSKVLNDFEPTPIFIWATVAYKDKIHGKITPYWKNAEVLGALIGENEPTKIWALFGIRTALPEFHVFKWMQNLKGQGLVKT